MNKKSSKSRTMILGGVLILGILVFFLKYTGSSKPSVCIEKNCFSVRIADDHQERKQGLMYIEHLPEKEGMIFLFPEQDIYSFWMKNTRIPLDMIWIDKNNSIVDIQTAQPCTQDPCPLYTPKASANKVLEINAGQTQSQNIKIGQRVQINM